MSVNTFFLTGVVNNVDDLNSKSGKPYALLSITTQNATVVKIPLFGTFYETRGKFQKGQNVLVTGVIEYTANTKYRPRTYAIHPWSIVLAPNNFSENIVYLHGKLSHVANDNNGFYAFVIFGKNRSCLVRADSNIFPDKGEYAFIEAEFVPRGSISYSIKAKRATKTIVPFANKRSDEAVQENAASEEVGAEKDVPF